jgi:hypothetical protein
MTVMAVRLVYGTTATTTTMCRSKNGGPMAAEPIAPWQYDLFVSYAHRDVVPAGRLSELTFQIAQSFEARAGRPPRIFVATEEIAQATLWEERISSALRASAALLVLYTESYFGSAACCREWDTFLILESERREAFSLRPYESLVFPILLAEPVEPESAGMPDRARRVRELRERQFVDLTHGRRRAAAAKARIERLVVDLLELLRKMSAGPAQVESVTAPPRPLTLVEGEATPLVTTYSGRDSRKLTALLAKAKTAVVVGIANSWVVDCVEAALAEKRRESGAGAFWDHLRVVFLAEHLLPYVQDEFDVDFPNPEEALKRRTQRAGSAKRQLMSFLLRSGVHGRWSLHTYPHLLPFAGNLFTMPDGKRVVQLAISRPSRAEEDNLYVDFLDRVDQFFESAFREIVEASREEHEVVLVGVPVADRGFLCRSARFRRAVMVQGRNTADWLAAVLVLTWRTGRHGPEPLLQINSPQNSTREIGKASHVSGYVNQRDQDGSAGRWTDVPLGGGEFVLSTTTAEAAVRRELLTDFDIADPARSPRLVDTTAFYYPDKENLYFYVFDQEVAPTHVFPEHVQMFGWTVDELMDVRKHQVCTNSIVALGAPMTSTQRRLVSSLVQFNLRAHAEPRLAAEVGVAMREGRLPEQLRRRLEQTAAAARVHKYSTGRELGVDGLAGLQYRAFFTHLLPTYAAVGVPGADAVLAAIDRDTDRAAAVRELSGAYLDEQLICSLPIEV